MRQFNPLGVDASIGAQLLEKAVENMLNPEQVDKVGELILRLKRVADIDEAHNAKRTIILDFLQFAFETTLEAFNVEPLRFMKSTFKNLVETDYNLGAENRITLTLFLIAVWCREIVASTSTTRSEFMNVLTYYESPDLPVSEYKYRVLLNLSDSRNTELVLDKCNVMVAGAKSWFEDKEKIFEDTFDSRKAEVESLTSRVEDLKGYIEKLHSQYNFSGLMHAFETMLFRINREKLLLVILLWVFGAALISVPVCIVFLYAYNVSFLSVLTIGNGHGYDYLQYVFRISPFILIEILLVYYFRIILQQYLSVKGQISQLQLRNALCMFIEKHAEFREGKGNSLDKFDALIFSPIVVQNDKIPSTLDGMDQIAKLFEKMNVKPK